MSETPINVTPPPDLTYGYVDGRIILAIGDRSDAGRMPDPIPAEGLTVTFTPTSTILKVASPTPATVIKQPIVCSVDANGYLIDGQSARGVWLVTGVYKVTYSHPRAMIPSHDIEVTTGHTEAAPLDLTTAMPPGGPVLTPSEYAELNGRLTILEAGGGGGGVTDHGALTGLGDDDHALYALADGTRGSFAAPLGADDNYVTDAEKAALHAHSNKAALDLVSGTNTGDQVLPTWSTISGKPAVVAEGATQADARTAIGAGTSNLSLGTTASTAAAGNRAATETATGMVELATTTEATTGTDTVRAVTPAGVKAVADTKADVSHAHTASQVSDSTATGQALLTAVDAAAARGTLGLATVAATGAYADLTGKPTTMTPTAHEHVTADVTDSTTVGRAVVTAATQAAARSAIGAGTSDLIIGTTASTASAGNHTHTLASLGAAAADGTYVVTTASASGAYAIPVTTAVQLSITGNTTMALPAVSAGCTILLRITGAFSVTWPASVASPPAYTSGSTYAATTLDGGASWIVKVVS